MKNLFSLIIIWGIVVGVNVTAYKYLFPDSSQPDTGGSGQTTKPGVPPTKRDGPPEMQLALDAFSGYAIFRDPEFKKRLDAVLAAQKDPIDYKWVDDKAEYDKRLQTIMKGETPLAVFTIDALIEQTAKLVPQPADPPATIVMFIDETRGADAMLAPKGSLIKNIDDLNHPDTKVVLVGSSPSETLLRVVRSRFDLSKLPDKRDAYLIPKEGPGEVVGALSSIPPGSRTAVVLWEPYVSIAKKEYGAKLLIDSSKFKGYIVDVLVVQRNYLKEHPNRVKAVVQTYLDLLHERSSRPEEMANLLVADAKLTGEKLTLEQTPQVIQGIRWKNTVENYAHFHLRPDFAGLQPVEEMIANITKVLSKTSDDKQDVVIKQPHKLFDDDVMGGLLKENLYVGKETIRPEDAAPRISDADWARLVAVGSIKAPPFPFSAGKAKLRELEPKEEADINTFLIELLNFPNYYFRIEGNTSAEGDPDANRILAEKRAETIKELLKVKGIAEHRIQTKAMPPGVGTVVNIAVLQKP